MDLRQLNDNVFGYSLCLFDTVDLVVLQDRSHEMEPAESNVSKIKNN